MTGLPVAKQRTSFELCRSDLQTLNEQMIAYLQLCFYELVDRFNRYIDKNNLLLSEFGVSIISLISKAFIVLVGQYIDVIVVTYKRSA